MQEFLVKQRTFFNSEATKSIDFRIQQLDLLEKVLKENEAKLFDAIYNDFKKSEFDTYTTELAIVYHEIKDAKKNLHYWARKERRSTNLTNIPGKSYVLKEPLGVCLVIGAWNYPYQLTFAPAVAAIAAGNTVILKPSEIPSQTSALIAELINTNFDASVFKVIEGGIPETTKLLAQSFDKIFFTGSTKVGKIVYQAAAKHLTPVTLELGGKSPAFVTADCNLKMTAKRLVWAKFLNAGQTCIAPDYVLVDTVIEKKFLEAVREAIENEHFAIENDNYVQIINITNFERLEAIINESTIYYGGKTVTADRYIEPTVLQNVDFDHVSMKDEIFGPILPVLTYDNLDNAIESVKKLPKPLAAYVFTSSKKNKKKVLDRLSFGGGMVNDAVMHITNSNIPFGGVGASGTGSYHGKAGFDAFSHHKSIIEKGNWIELPLKYFPRSASKFTWIKRLLKLQ